MTPRCFIHPLSDVQSASIGAGTKVWQFAVVLPQARIGRDCNICSHVFVENDVIVGDRVTVKCGVQLWDGLRIADDVFIGPNVTFCNDRHPRSKVYPDKFLTTTIRRGASIGANATILPGVTVGEGAMVGAGAVVVCDVPAHTTVVGNPAAEPSRIRGGGVYPSDSAPSACRSRIADAAFDTRAVVAVQNADATSASLPAFRLFGRDGLCPVRKRASISNHLSRKESRHDYRAAV